MKKIKYILFLSLFISFSCGEDVFELTPLDKISDADVWNDPALMRSYLTDVYQKLPFNNRLAQGRGTLDTRTDIGTTNVGNLNAETSGAVSRTHDARPFWRYDIIRELNIFLERLVDAEIPQMEKNQFEGEARVLRAMVYYEKQIRYGGVPLVDVPLNPFAPIDQKYTLRSTEEQIADFIDNDLSLAIQLLSEDTRPLGRINKWTAYAFKARANLYSASIAKYGNVQINGLVGIPSARANEFYNNASNAANTVIQSGKYELFNQHDDKSENYRLLFVTADNSEAIFSKLYDGVILSHQHNIHHLPPSIAGGHGAFSNPLYDYIVATEKIDGSTDPPLIGPEHLYNSAYQAFEDRDPRIHAVVFFDGDVFAGHEIRTYEGIDPSPVPNPSNILSTYGETYNGIPQVAEDSRLMPFDDKSPRSGLMLKKNMSDNVFQAYVGTPWIELRLGEVYLIRAEAEFELGNLEEAATALNATRERAGMSLVDASTISLDRVRTERMSELAWEEQRWWDLRRWRIAEEVLNIRTMQGLRTILHYETGQYYFLPVDAEPFARTFSPEHYYNPITDQRRNNNPDLLENPGY